MPNATIVVDAALKARLTELASQSGQRVDEFVEALLRRIANADIRLDRGILDGAGVEVRHMEDSRCHGRSRLYSLVKDARMSDEATEIFDDLYLGLRAGGALRKQRRGESLTTEEIEALTRWQRLSPWRKVVAM